MIDLVHEDNFAAPRPGTGEPVVEPDPNGRNEQPRAEPRLAILTVAYNSASVLPGLLDSLQDGLAGISAFEVVVADNASADNSVEISLDHPIRPRVIKMGRNAGYSAGINAAAATVREDADLLILNPDVRLLPGAARKLVERLSDPAVGVAVPKVLHEDGEVAWSLRREPSIITAWSDCLLGGERAGRIGLGEKISDPARYEKDGFVEWAEGSVLAVAARARALVGNWDESFFLYSEEVDYMRRVRAAGQAVAYVPGAQAIHIGGESETNPFLSALLARNRLRYYRRHHGWLSTALFRLSMVLGEGLRAGQGPAHRAALRVALTVPASEPGLSR